MDRQRTFLRNTGPAWVLVMMVGGTPLAWAMPPAEQLMGMPLESLLEVPVSVSSPFREQVVDAAAVVSVLQPEDWERRGARDLAQALEQVPAVVPYRALGGATMIGVRGYANELTVRGTALRLDGVPLNSFTYATAFYSLPFLPLPLLSRIEMIRGPGSPLYGADAFHSVIALQTPDVVYGYRPQSMTVSTGTNNDGQVAVLGHESAGAWLLSAGAAVTHQGDGNRFYAYTDPVSGDLAMGERDEHLRDIAGFLHVDNDDIGPGRWHLSFYADDYHSRDYPGIGTQLYQALGAATQSASVNFDADRDVSGQRSSFWQAQLSHERLLPGELSLEWRGYQWQSDQEWQFDHRELPLTLTANDGTVLPCRTGAEQSLTTVSPLFCPNTLFQGAAERRQGLSGLLRQSQRRWGTKWALGLGREWLTVRRAWAQLIAPTGQRYLDRALPFQGADRRIDYLLLHARTDWAAQRWALVYGVRWDDYSDVGHATSPRLGLIYQPTPAWTSKLLYSQAFRAPGAAEPYGVGIDPQRLNFNVQAETIRTLELVLQERSAWHEAELVWFASRWHDGIVLVPVSTAGSRYENAAENVARGVELSYRRRLGRWQLEGNAAYVRSRNRAGGYDYGAFPRYVVNFNLGRGLWASGWNLWLNQRCLLDYTETDVLAGQVPAAAPDYYRVDARLQYERAGQRFWLEGRNLFGRRNVMPSTYNAEGGLPDERRGVHLGLEWPF